MHRKKFPCGHQGFGQFCHRCREKESRLKAQREKREQSRTAYMDDEIDLRKLPVAIAEKTRRIIKSLQRGASYTEFKGKRLNYDRKQISIPITRDFRLMVEDTDHGLTPKRVMSHEEYNTAKPGRKK